VGDGYHLRAQYLIGALQTRSDKLEEALVTFEALRDATPVAPNDNKVLELSHIARGRLLYELDRMNEAVDAYQYIPWSSGYLTTMLYEVTWTYVRRAQLIRRDEELSEVDRKERALADYELALDQLQDLRLLEPDSTRAADFTLLAGSLRLQRGEFDEAGTVFEEVLAKYAAADGKLTAIMKDAVKRERIIQDILAMEGGALSIESDMPSVAARRAADNDEVANAVRVFRDLETSRSEIDAAEKMLVKLESLLTSDTRAELFPDLREALTKAYGIENEVLALRSRLADVLHAIAQKEGARDSAELAAVRQRREELAAKVASMPTSGEGLTQRKERFDAGFERLEGELHKISLEIQGLRAQLNAVDMLYSAQKDSSETTPGELERSKRRIEEFLAIVSSMEEERDRIRAELDEAKLTTTISGGSGASEAGLRAAYKNALDEEQELLRAIGTTPRLQRVRQADARAAKLGERNATFLGRLNSVVDRHVGEMRQALDMERENLRVAAQELDNVKVAAQDIRDVATTVAIDHVRAEVHDIVVRADVGLIDTAFARKQRETEKIGRLQRQRAAELTDLNQAYADLTADEAVD
jgi:tetratricopeptide (TPR) repeat protein